MMAEDTLREMMTDQFSDLDSDDDDDQLPEDSSTDYSSDEEGGQNLAQPINFRPSYSKTIPFAPLEFDFHQNLNYVSPTLGVTEESSYLDIFRKLFTDDIVNLILGETNRFVDQVKKDRPQAFPKWTELKIEEFYQFVALHLTMGLVDKPALKDYWSTEKVLFTPFFPEVMARDRFLDILRALHFVNNETIPEGNKNRFIKLGTIMESVENNFKRAVNPSRNLCIDESLLPYHGRLSFKQYNPKKRGRFGIKFFVLCDAETNFTIKILPYQGKSTAIKDQDWITEYKFGGAAVLTLAEEYLHKGHCLTIDNWFMSPTLAKKLLESKTHVLGTVQKTRKGMPVMHRKLNRGEIEIYSNGHILIERWSDRRDVVILNTYVRHQMIHVNARNPANSRLKPASVIEYNRTMGALDNVDQIIRTYQSLRKTLKWYKKVFFNLIDTVIYNTYVLFAKLHPEKPKIPYKNFVIELVHEILQVFPVQRRKRGRPETSLVDEDRLMGVHLPIKVTKNGKSYNRDCTLCRMKGERHTCHFKCEKCNVHLCIQNENSCFKEFHSRRTLPNGNKRRRTGFQEAVVVNVNTEDNVAVASMEVGTLSTTEEENSVSILNGLFHY